MWSDRGAEHFARIGAGEVKTLIALVCAASLAAPAAGQSRPSFTVNDTPPISLRPFFVLSGEHFSAHDTFTAVFGQSSQIVWGGGLQVAFRNGSYIDVTASRFKKTGQRAFILNGHSFPLGIPLTASLTPFEGTVGHRFTAVSSRAIPYLGVGVGSYSYTEESDDPGDKFDARHLGYLLVGGLEFRLGRWFGVSGDAQYTRVPGIIGSDGISKEAGEDNLGGIAARVRVIVGR